MSTIQTNQMIAKRFEGIVFFSLSDDPPPHTQTPHTHIPTHTQVYCRESSISRTSIWFMALTELKVGGEKQVKQQEQSVTPPCLQQGVSFCCIPPCTYMHVRSHTCTQAPYTFLMSFPVQLVHCFPVFLLLYLNLSP